MELSKKNKDSAFAEYNYYNTLAAAYAEAGDFDKAVFMESMACKLYEPGITDETEIECKELLEAYKKKQTYIQWESMNREQK